MFNTNNKINTDSRYMHPPSRHLFQSMYYSYQTFWRLVWRYRLFVVKSQHSSPPHSACRRIRSRRSVCYWLAGCTRYITNAPLASQQKIYLHSLFLPAKTHKCLKPARNDSYPNSSEDAFNYTEKRTLNFSRCVGKFFFSYL